ncbi:hypothetical protein [Roseateles koreensis]|uniref:Uncharacterized protein n=1 Tax=Roseateles koreensis TaxID=2987526 RepID=A0ABT5KPR1_9BURK|nr:hypothetical protein [Roseateles koreensis]MDC8784907.1 hypothetical protein [Roseateles koreensis]
MNQQNQTSLDTKQDSAHGLGAGLPADKLEARRRLLKGGLALAPVAMTVTSRPVLAGSNAECHGPTGFQSANVSRQVGTVSDPTCGVRKRPADWSGDTTHWPSSCKSTANFSTCFPSTSKYASNTLLEVLQGSCGGTSDDKAVSQRIGAAYLNCLAGQTVPSLIQIRAIWSGYCSAGGYRPTSGEAVWSAAKICKYLDYTMGVGVSF